ncbi:hypothetical protein OPV22_004764 [Ensete ventricosum]|uniref:Uncharacterized protein n=1 Tax=Ensete ventricosum TaxID=4639 RepID=A0AAV8RPM6_ENSVE|nr:hypothetical protein OPV22_004764 [Ensete ventricosum]
MGRPLPPGCNSGGYSNIPKPTGSPANFSSQGYAEPDSTLQVSKVLQWLASDRKELLVSQSFFLLTEGEGHQIQLPPLLAKDAQFYGLTSLF